MVTKSAYTRSLDCPRYAWLYQYSRATVADAIDLQRAWRMEQGDVVERYARQLFPGGILLRGFGLRAAKETERQVGQGAECLFQATVMTNGLHAMADVLKQSPIKGSWDIYEVKSSTSVTDRQLRDVCFQKLAFERAGYTIGRVFIVHIDRTYIGNGEIEPSRLFVMVDVTREVAELVAEVERGILTAERILNLRQIPPVEDFPCSCSPKNCPCLDYCFPGLPDGSVYFVSRMPLAKARSLYAGGCRLVQDIPDSTKLSARQRLQVAAAKQGTPSIDRPAIQSMLGALAYPLYFLDYETFSEIVPPFAGFGPNEKMPFQYSLHVLRTPTSEPEHYEYLAPAYCNTIPGLVAALRDHIGDTGAIVSWNKKFEKSCNSNMGRLHPDAAPFLSQLNQRMFDLMDVIDKQYYVDARFNGSCSIKEVLPVLIPQLSYKSLEIQEGNSASLAWYRMLASAVTSEERAKTALNLLEYCKLDTFAMVELFRFLRGL